MPDELAARATAAQIEELMAYYQIQADNRERAERERQLHEDAARGVLHIGGPPPGAGED